MRLNAYDGVSVSSLLAVIVGATLSSEVLVYRIFMLNEEPAAIVAGHVDPGLLNEAAPRPLNITEDSVRALVPAFSIEKALVVAKPVVCRLPKSKLPTSGMPPVPEGMYVVPCLRIISGPSASVTRMVTGIRYSGSSGSLLSTRIVQEYSCAAVAEADASNWIVNVRLVPVAKLVDEGCVVIENFPELVSLMICTGVAAGPVRFKTPLADDEFEIVIGRLFEFPFVTLPIW